MKFAFAILAAGAVALKIRSTEDEEECGGAWEFEDCSEMWYYAYDEGCGEEGGAWYWDIEEGDDFWVTDVEYEAWEECNPEGWY